MEEWMSGLNQQFTKLSTGKTVREFESHILRKLDLIIKYCKTLLLFNTINMEPKNTINFKKVTGWVKQLRSRYMLTLAAHRIFLELDRARTISHSGEKAAEKNVEIFKKYSYYFIPTKESIRYYLIIELAKFFEVDSKKSLTLDFLLNYTEDNLKFLSKDYFKSYHKDRKFLIEDIERLEEISISEIESFRKRIKNSHERIERIKNYRDKYIAHDDLKKKTYTINTRDISTLLILVRDIIDYYYKKLEWASTIYDNFDKEPVRDTKRIFTDLKNYNIFEKDKIKEKWGLK